MNDFAIKSQQTNKKYIVRTCFYCATSQTCSFPNMEQAKKKFVDIVQGAVYNTIVSKVQLIIDYGTSTYDEVMVMELRKGGI